MSTDRSKPGGSPPSKTNLYRMVSFAHQLDELVAPVDAIMEYATFLLKKVAKLSGGDYKLDLERIHGAAEGLRALLQENLSTSETSREGMTEAIRIMPREIRHDLKTPLNHIIGYSELLIEDAEENGHSEVLEADLVKIRDWARKVTSVIETKASSDPAQKKLKRKGSTTEQMIQQIVSTIGPRDTTSMPVQEIRGSVIVVDDNELNREILGRQIERQGHHVDLARDGREGLDMIHDGDYDLALLDVMMPGLNGFELLDILRKEGVLRRTSVIMLSAFDDLGSVARCLSLGAEDYIPKPFDPVILEARMKAVLEKVQLRRREEQILEEIEMEKARADGLLRAILPEEIINELKTKGSVPPRRHENVAVLFSDIVGFTKYCEGHSPEHVVSNLQALVESFESLTIQHNAQKIKTIGDAYMATAGLLRPVDNPVRTCVELAGEMMKAARAAPTPWALRIGIHVGPVVAGILGQSQFLYDLWGDTVNLAARMESHGVPGRIALSPDAYAAISNFADASSRGTIMVKGKGEMEVYVFDRFR